MLKPGAQIRDVALIDAGPRSLRKPFFPNLGIGYIATALEKEGLTVEVVDREVASDHGWAAFLERIPAVVGITATSFTWDRVMISIADIKHRRPDTKIIVGGPHVSVSEANTLDVPSIDYAVIGEGEEVMPRLTRMILEGKDTPEQLAEIPGLIYRQGGEVKMVEKAPWIRDLGALGRPAFHLFQMEAYEAYPLLTSRGCPYQCVFCSVPAVSGRPWRYRKADELVDEIEWALGKWNIPHRWFVIVDDTFNLKLQRVHEFCDLVTEKKLDIVWGIWGLRADRAPRDLCEKMRKAGCLTVAIGIESADDDMLLKIKKGESLADLEQGIANLAGAGIEITGQFMIGNPGDTPETIERSIDFARRMPLATVEFYLARPYPKTELWEFAKQNGRIIHADYTRFHHFSNTPVFDTPDFPAEERMRLYRKARRLVIQRNTMTTLKRKARMLRKRIFAEAAA